MLVYDVRSRASLDNLYDWWDELDTFTDYHRDRHGRKIKLPLMVVANKVDLPVGQPFGLDCFCFLTSPPQQQLTVPPIPFRLNHSFFPALSRTSPCGAAPGSPKTTERSSSRPPLCTRPTSARCSST